MTPIDTTPHGGEIMHEPPDRRFPQPKPGQESDEPMRGSPGADEPEDEPDIAHRPPLPDHPVRMAVDVEDEEADPVIESGPGLDRVKSPRKQKG